MSNMTIRNPHEMDKFANEIDQYVSKIKKTCKSLESDLNSSKIYLRDEPSKKALSSLYKLCEELQMGLPSLKKASEQLKSAAKPLYKANDIF